MRFEKRQTDSRLTRIMQTSRKTQKFSGIVPWIKPSAKQRHSNAPAQNIYAVFPFYLGCVHFVPELTKNANARTLLIGGILWGEEGGERIEGWGHFASSSFENGSITETSFQREARPNQNSLFAIVTLSLLSLAILFTLSVIKWVRKHMATKLLVAYYSWRYIWQKYQWKIKWPLYLHLPA